MDLVYDIETNGLAINEESVIHCIVAMDVDTEQIYTFTPAEISEGVALLNQADTLIGHNIVGFDNPFIAYLYPSFAPKVSLDTMIVGQMIHPDFKNLPKGLRNHRLVSWGEFVGGEQKMDYTGGFEAFSEEMLTYCIQDVKTNLDIYNHQLSFIRENRSQVEFEMQVSALCRRITANGMAIDKAPAMDLYAKYKAEQDSLVLPLREYFPTVVTRRFSDKLIDKETGKPKELKSHVDEFNPGSRPQWARRLADKYGWVPKDLTPKDNPKIDEAVLSSLDYPEAPLGARYFELDKIMGLINAWLTSESDGRIHSRYNPLGTATTRATHSKPNIAQVPKGPKFRCLFRPTDPGRVMVGCDLSGIQLRCLAHYLSYYDNGSYARALLEDDIHTVNQKAAGLPTRDDAKTFIYALMFGAGDKKIGKIVKGTEKDGSRLRRKFYRSIPGIERLMKDVPSKAKHSGGLLLLDGRKIRVREDYKALNTLLQGAEAIIAKQWLLNIEPQLPPSAKIVAWVHDEVQLECDKEDAEAVAPILETAATEAGKQLNFHLPVDAEAKIGPSWAETH